MKNILSNEQMRISDGYTIGELKTPSATLMRRAGLALADEAERAAVKQYGKNDGAQEGAEILIVCGAGNNGGDGYVCAAELLKRGFNVAVYAICGDLSVDCAREKNLYNGRYLTHIRGSIIVDCLFGTGISRNISGECAEIIKGINDSGAYVISADVPSGLTNCGKVSGVAVKANKTVAIAEHKLAYYLNDGPDLCGEVVRKDIGITVPESVKTSCVKVYDDGDIAKFFPKRKRNTHKGDYGSCNIVAGSEKYVGAAALSLSAALKSGCGIVKLTTAEKVKFSLAPKFPQAIYTEEIDLNAQAISIGSGCGVSERLYKDVDFILKNYTGSLVIDADGLNALSKFGKDILKNKKCGVILTPHVKEFSRLSGEDVDEITSDPVKKANSFAKEYGVTLMLKSATTVICDGENAALNVRGSTALSKGGSGDMLSGYLCGTLARGLNLFDAAVCSAYILGVAAEISSEERTDYCATAYDIINNMHIAIKRLTYQG